jgi:hypothetical protein
MPYVQIAVLEEHVPAVYALLARLQSGEDAKPELTEAVVARMYADSLATHRSLLEYFAARPDGWIGTSELAKALSLDGKGIAGTLGAFGNRAKHRYDGLKPWDHRWDDKGGEVVYKMSPEVAGWIEAATP